MAIIDWNTTNLKDKVFHFKNSLRPFIEIVTVDEDTLFVDIDKGVAYTLDDLENESLFFYLNEEDEMDEDFRGVDVDGKIEWVE